MARELYVFIRSEDGLASVLKALVALFGQEFATHSTDFGPIHRVTLLGHEIDVFDNHGLEDDCGIEFSRFDTELRLRPLGIVSDPSVLRQVCRSVAILVARYLEERSACECIVVDGLQKVIGQMPEDAG